MGLLNNVVGDSLIVVYCMFGVGLGLCSWWFAYLVCWCMFCCLTVA